MRPDVSVRAALHCALVFAATIAALEFTTAPVSAQGPAPGGLIESATTRTVRPLMTPAEIEALLPPRGGFTFPPPYGTRGIRITNASDCSGADCVGGAGASS